MSWFKQKDSSDESKPVVPSVRPTAPKPSVQRAAPSTKRGQAAPPGPATHIAEGSTVEGEVTGDAELLVDGKVDGEIRLDSTVIVGDKGLVEGTIDAVAVQVGGRVKGDIFGREKVEVLASGRLEGDVTAPKVVIADGAFFKGKVDMSGNVRPKSTPPPAAKAAVKAPPGAAKAGITKPTGAAADKDSAKASAPDATAAKDKDLDAPTTAPKSVGAGRPAGAGSKSRRP